MKTTTATKCRLSHARRIITDTVSHPALIDGIRYKAYKLACSETEKGRRNNHPCWAGTPSLAA